MAILKIYRLWYLWHIFCQYLILRIFPVWTKRTVWLTSLYPLWVLYSTYKERWCCLLSLALPCRPLSPSSLHSEYDVSAFNCCYRVCKWRKVVLNLVSSAIFRQPLRNARRKIISDWKQFQHGKKNVPVALELIFDHRFSL